MRHCRGRCHAPLLCFNRRIASADGCKNSRWSLAREQAWVAAPDKAIIAAGQARSLRFEEQPLSLTFNQRARRHSSLPPERKPRSDQWFGGTVRFSGHRTAGHLSGNPL